MNKLKLKPEVKADHDRRKYLDDQQEVFCDGVMLHYNEDKKHFEITEVVSSAGFWIDGLDVDIKSDKYGALYIEQDDSDIEYDKHKFTSHPDRWFINYYHCKDCDEKWEMEWDSDCDDKCPKCHSAYTPYKSEEQDNE